MVDVKYELVPTAVKEKSWVQRHKCFLFSVGCLCLGIGITIIFILI